MSKDGGQRVWPFLAAAIPRSWVTSLQMLDACFMSRLRLLLSM